MIDAVRAASGLLEVGDGQGAVAQFAVGGFEAEGAAGSGGRGTVGSDDGAEVAKRQVARGPLPEGGPVTASFERDAELLARL